MPQPTYRMKPYRVIRNDTSSANWVGSQPVPLHRNLDLDATLVARRSDDALFLLIGATTHPAQASKWLHREIARLETQAVSEEWPHEKCWWRTDPPEWRRPRLTNIEATRDEPNRISRAQ